MWTFFIWLQVVTCAGAAIGLILTRQYSLAWVWGCYSAANVGWAIGVK